MKKIVWNRRYEIGVDFIDKEHKILFSTMNKILAFIEDESKAEWACREGIKFLKNHTIAHFEHEEEYMRSIGYEGYEVHKRLHDDFKDYTLPMLEQEMEEMEYSDESIRHFLGVCIGWVISHTQTEDLAIKSKVNSKWKDIPKEKEQEVIVDTIMPIFQDIFHMKLKLISEQYYGQDFGKVMCFRFIYKDIDKKRWEVILIYEEQLLLTIMSDILNVEYLKIDDMAINVSRYLSRQFLEQIRECFPSLEFFELDKESLLTHEQLLDAFDNNQPSCSLLFDTGEGYFAFSAVNVDHFNGKIEHSIDPNNVINVVSDYLTKENKEWEEQKKKILIVDDSEFIRKKMKSLLENDYSILEAASSIAAIQEIILNRPDLVLLDYEMPVCDGRQTLEMIRSEKAIANIPVIFLTAKGDMESVKKVMALKPEGYMLKKLTDEEIKTAIDEFFKKHNG